MNRKRISFIVWLTTLTVLVVLLLTGCAMADTLTLPSSVTAIEDEAFFGDYHIDAIVLPDGLLSIGERAFDRTSITSVRLPSSLQSIADSAFDNTELEKIEAEYGTYAYEWAYQYASSHDGVSVVTPTVASDGDTIKRRQYAGQTIDVLVIGDNIKTIEAKAFSGAKIRQLFLPASVEEIEYDAFSHCTIERVELISGSYAAENLYSGHWGELNWKQVIKLEKNTDNEYTLVGLLNWSDDLTSYVVPSAASDGTKISVIGSGALHVSGPNLTSVTIQEGIEEIRDDNLWSLSYIKELYLPQSLKSVGSNCFRNAGDAYDEEIKFDLPSGITFVGEESFVSKKSTPTAVYCLRKNSDTDNALRLAGNKVVFSYFQHPDWIMQYKGGYWQGDDYINETIVYTLQYRGTSKHVFVPQVGKGVLEGGGLYNNDDVESVYVPEGYIQTGSFSYCDNLKNITLPSTMQKPIDPWYCHDDLQIHIPAGSAIINELEKLNQGRVCTYSFYPGLSASAELTDGDLKLALTYTALDTFTVNPWPVGPELSTQEETAVILSFLEKVCATESGKRIALTSLRIPNLCGEKITAHYFDVNGRKVNLSYTIDTMLIATGKIKGSLFGLSAGAASVVGTAWINYNGMQYVIAPSSPESIVHSLEAMQTILHLDAAEMLKEELTLNLDVYDVFGKNGLIAYLQKIFAEVGIDTASLETISEVESAIESKSDEEYYEHLRKLLEIAKNLD